MGGDAGSDDWLISPEVDLSAYTNLSLDFYIWYRYSDTVLGLDVKVSTDYSGSGNPGTATWTSLNLESLGLPASEQTWESRHLDLSAYEGQPSVHIAFQYESTGTGSGTSRWWQMDEVTLQGTLQEEIANPLAGQIIDIGDSLFTVKYGEGDFQKNTTFTYTNGLVTQDTLGNMYSLKDDFETISLAEVAWNKDEASGSKMATDITVFEFVLKADTVITGPIPSSLSLMITGIIDGPLSGGTPKAVELYAIEDISDLGFFGIGSANNGGGTDGVELVLSDSIAKGSFIYIATEEPNFKTWFVSNPNFVDEYATAINGNDAIELFYDSTKTFSGREFVIDVFGDINIDGTGTNWEYSNGWAYRVNYTAADSSIFNSHNWIFSGVDALDGESSNATASTPFPAGTFKFVRTDAAEEIQEMPLSVQLHQNYPNPFNPSTTINYDLDHQGHVNLTVYNLMGQKVAELVNEVKNAGTYRLNWNAGSMASGMYYYRLEANGKSVTRKMLLIK